MKGEELRERSSDGYWYMAPFSVCRSCHELTPLPYPNLPQTDQDQLESMQDSDLLEWPSEKWSLMLGCCECGRVETVALPDLLAEIVPHRSTGTFHDEATFFAVEFPCADRHCKAPQTIHADSQGRSAKELIRLFRDGFYQGTLSCGHPLKTVPEQFYKARRILERLW